MKNLCELLVADRPTLALAEMELDEITIKVKRYVPLELCKGQHLLKFICKKKIIHSISYKELKNEEALAKDTMSVLSYWEMALYV
jgi:hypothetical protein